MACTIVLRQSSNECTLLVFSLALCKLNSPLGAAAESNLFPWNLLAKGLQHLQEERGVQVKNIETVCRSAPPICLLSGEIMIIVRSCRFKMPKEAERKNSLIQ